MWYRATAEGWVLTLHVQPGAKRSELVGLHGDAMKVRLAAPAIEGRANAALIRFMADLFDVPLRHVTLLQGEQSRRKIIEIKGGSDPALLGGN